MARQLLRISRQDISKIKLNGWNYTMKHFSHITLAAGVLLLAWGAMANPDDDKIRNILPEIRSAVLRWRFKPQSLQLWQFRTNYRVALVGSFRLPQFWLQEPRPLQTRKRAQRNTPRHSATPAMKSTPRWRPPRRLSPARPRSARPAGRPSAGFHGLRLGGPSARIRRVRGLGLDRPGPFVFERFFMNTVERVRKPGALAPVGAGV